MFIRVTAPIAAAAAVATVGLAAPVVHADTTQFINDVQAAGFNDGSFGATGLEETGTFICAQLDQGQSPGDVVATATLTMTNLPPYQIGQFMAITVDDLCPQHSAQMQQWANTNS
jgi:hypothetical protein